MYFPDLQSFGGVVPRNYGFVVIAGTGAFFVNLAHIYEVAKARKKHNVQPPVLYHPTNNEYNCVQRSHQNYLEKLPLSLMLLFVGGLRYPRSSAAFYAIYLGGRIAYMIGYNTGEPKNRIRGMFGYAGLLGLLLNTLTFGVTHAVASVKAKPCCH
ncbi:Microsomal glutathione S-transferase 3 [Cichlidogyrus casuarinus]|uniref:Microsomal glutathione S-transferase 3 n=1 Tax=Cichlidogyrus casuarinus TaxID=1844966 RepID=A0ABD2Q8R3_9PLAT